LSSGLSRRAATTIGTSYVCPFKNHATHRESSKRKKSILFFVTPIAPPKLRQALLHCAIVPLLAQFSRISADLDNRDSPKFHNAFMIFGANFPVRHPYCMSLASS
jgi:hypothetical protein